MEYERFRTIEEVKHEMGMPLHSLAYISSSRSVRVIATITFSVFILLVFSLLFLPWNQTVQGKGKVIAYYASDRQQEIQAPVEGRIVRWLVTEGSKVKQNDLLAEMSDIDPHFLDRVKQERDAAQAKLQAAQKSLETSKKNVHRQEMLFKQGLSSKRMFELAELEEAKFLSDVASSSAELARIETKLARQASQIVVAQRDGIIQSIVAPQGGVLVKQGDKLAILVPDTEERAVELWIDGNDLPIVTPGKAVRIQFEGWPAVQFSGWPSVAIGTFGGVVSFIDPSDNGKGKFRVLVTPNKHEPWPESRFLRQGVRAVGWIMLDNVRLGWELWRRFNAFPVTSSEAPPETAKEDSH